MYSGMNEDSVWKGTVNQTVQSLMWFSLDKIAASYDQQSNYRAI